MKSTDLPLYVAGAGLSVDVLSPSSVRQTASDRSSWLQYVLGRCFLADSRTAFKHATVVPTESVTAIVTFKNAGTSELGSMSFMKSIIWPR